VSNRSASKGMLTMWFRGGRVDVFHRAFLQASVLASATFPDPGLAAAQGPWFSLESRHMNNDDRLSELRDELSCHVLTELRDMRVIVRDPFSEAAPGFRARP